MAEIRRYTKNDAVQVGRLIADTYGEFNLREMSARRRALMLGPFVLAGSQVSGNQEAIADAISAPSVWVAEQGVQIIGVIRGGRTDHSGRTVLMSLFVSGPHQGRGIGRALVERFESEYTALGASVIKVSATLFAVPFYSRLGYKKTTGVRSASSFGEPGLPYQPMARVLS